MVAAADAPLSRVRAIRTARRGAAQGVIFAPAAGTFREIIARAVYEVDIEGLVDVLPGEDGFARRWPAPPA